MRRTGAPPPPGATTHPRRREGWTRALLLLAGAVVMALCGPAGTHLGLDLSPAIVSTGIAGWVLGQLVGYITWRRAGAGDREGAARRSVGTAALVVVPLITGVTTGTVLLSSAPSLITAALGTAWAVYVVSLTLVAVLGGLRPLAVLAVGTALASLLATLAGAAAAPLATVGVLAGGGAILATRTYRSVTRRRPALPSGADVRSAVDGVTQSVLMAAALLLALHWSDQSTRVPLSVASILAAALCDPAVEDLGIRLRSLSHRSRHWREVLAGVLLRTLVYFTAIAAAAVGTAWVVHTVLTPGDHHPGAVPDGVILSVFAPVFALFVFGTSIVLRAGRIGEAMRISALACVGFAALLAGWPTLVGVVLLCLACAVAVAHSVDAASTPTAGEPPTPPDPGIAPVRRPATPAPSRRPPLPPSRRGPGALGAGARSGGREPRRRQRPLRARGRPGSRLHRGPPAPRGRRRRALRVRGHRLRPAPRARDRGRRRGVAAVVRGPLGVPGPGRLGDRRGWGVDPGALHVLAVTVAALRRQGVVAVAGNPGTVPDPRVVRVLDVTCVRETDLATHLGPDAGGLDGRPGKRPDARPAPLRGVDPARLWHLVYDCPPEWAARALARSAELGAGLVGLSPDPLPHPWGSVGFLGR